ncbi:2-methylisoborneol synthase [Pseudomonas sp. ok272]|uniref:family 2 encapsulin nanocompartment cargo protein terpene cyclase n=1 Tax=unclassified Pseudomonas TaxID=196821 RepID=UPI0008C88681|nr:MULTISPECIES: family 2 encapsulin nanocompartment cargo protein terpene cyclase [unclassified Pseudomonas]SEN53817.1 2-methylisoborneol synthase [Pseudomonas sp. ok272]SFN35314.1 2-methylisoborneol synthase [Pseudomonas sp. ok602]
MSHTTDPATAAATTGLSVPPLHCPTPVRIDEPLGQQVDSLLLPWIERVGIFAGQLEKIRASRFGRFAMLCHPDTDEPDRLLLSAQCIAALFAVDDYYCDDDSQGSVPEQVGSRLSVALAALEPAHLTGEYIAALERALDADPVLRGLRAYMVRVAQFASPAQIARVRHEIIAMFVTMGAEASWRLNRQTPSVWEYLAHRQVNSFLPCMSLIDIVGGYELPANLYCAPMVRRVTTLAASATIIANDLYSMHKEGMTVQVDFNLPQLLVAHQQCSLAEAMTRTASIHDDVVRAYEAAEQRALPAATPELERFLGGLKAWVAGSREWHQHSGRYQA